MPLPEHVQHPGALLVGGHAGHPRHVLEAVVDDAIVGVLIVPEPHALRRLAEAGDEVVPSVRVLAEEQREVGREPLAQPHVVPLGLRDRVAEPLVRDLVDDDVAPAHRPVARYRILAVHEGGRGLHAPAGGRGRDVGELLVDEGAHVVVEEGEDLEGGDGEVVEARVAVARVHPGLHRLPVELAQGLDGETRHADDKQPGRYGHRLPPVGAAHASADVGLLHDDTVGHHLVVRGRGDDELACGLLRHVVHRGQPVAGAVGPVVAEEGAFAVLVGPDAETGGGRAPIAHGHRVPLAGAAGPGKPDREEIVLVAVFEGSPRSCDPDDLHPLAVGPHADQVEREARDPVRRETKPHRGPSCDLVAVVAERQFEAVRLYVDPGARPLDDDRGVRLLDEGSGRCPEQKERGYPR